MNNLKIYFLILGSVVFLAMACSRPADNGVATNNASNAKDIPPQPQSPPETATALPAKQLYTVNCMTCHKDSGKGGKVTIDGKQLNPDDLTSASMKAKSDEKLYKYVADGIEDEGMPAFKDKLNPAEIRSIVVHMRDLQNNPSLTRSLLPPGF